MSRRSRQELTIFEAVDGSNPVATEGPTTQLFQYAITGTLPDEGATPAGPSPPAQQCLGSADVPVP